jgi:hypothetical protein
MNNKDRRKINFSRIWAMENDINHRRAGKGLLVSKRKFLHASCHVVKKVNNDNEKHTNSDDRFYPSRNHRLCCLLLAYQCLVYHQPAAG